MKTNTELLMNALGWQGGTIHQVAKVTGIKVGTILDLHKLIVTDVYQLEMCNNGYMWAHSGGGERNIVKDRRGYPFYWLGALCFMMDK